MPEHESEFERAYGELRNLTKVLLSQIDSREAGISSAINSSYDLPPRFKSRAEVATHMYDRLEERIKRLNDQYQLVREVIGRSGR
jgi:hypothetical protein